MNRIAFLTLFSMAFSSTMAQSDVVIDWNSTLSDVLLSNTTLQNPGMASRSMAMMNLAIYDAGNGVSPSHEQFYVHAAAPANSSYDAAASQAAYTVLSSIYTDAPTRSILDSQLATTLAAIPDGAAKTNGISYGSLVGTNVFNARTSDGFSNTVNYTPQSAVGHWEPDPLNPTQEAWGPQWGNLKTFGIADTNAFTVPPMPTLTSMEYADAFNEVISLGAKTSTTRTADQTEIAIFWAFDRLGIGTPMRMYNKIMRDISVQEGNTTEENARMFAMASTAIADAGITAWDAKFRFDFWRPISGIRRADEDGNPLTIADPDWEPLGAPGGIAPDGTLIPDFTPPFPTYLSGHASFGSAMFGSLENFYGTDAIAFSATSEELPGVTRSYATLTEAMQENGRSRVYMGIHWNFDDLESHPIGYGIADYITTNHFAPVPEPSGAFVAVVGGVAMLTFRRRR